MIYNSRHTGEEIDNAVDKVGTLEEEIANKQDALLPDELQNINDIPQMKSDLGTQGGRITDLESDKQDKLTEVQIQNINDIPNKQDALLPDELSDIRDIPNIRSQVDTNGSALREFEELTFTYENGDTATLKVVVKRD